MKITWNAYLRYSGSTMCPPHKELDSLICILYGLQEFLKKAVHGPYFEHLRTAQRAVSFHK